MTNQFDLSLKLSNIFDKDLEVIFHEILENGFSRLIASRKGIKSKFPLIICQLFSLREIILDNNLLEGSIPSSIFQLSQLEILNLANNHMEGCIPQEICSLQHLKFLSLRDNSFTGEIPADIGNMKHLEVLRLNNNNLQGTLPSSLQYLTSITCLDLSYNHIEGNILGIFSETFGSSLQILHLANNNFTGCIPSAIGALVNLSSLHLNDNDFSGVIPDMWTHLEKLRQLYLHNNHLKGVLPSSLLDLPYLSMLCIDGNRELSGFENIWKLASLQVLDIDLAEKQFIPKQLHDTGLANQLAYMKSLSTFHHNTPASDMNIPPSACEGYVKIVVMGSSVSCNAIATRLGENTYHRCYCADKTNGADNTNGDLISEEVNSCKQPNDHDCLHLNVWNMSYHDCDCDTWLHANFLSLTSNAIYVLVMDLNFSITSMMSNELETCCCVLDTLKMYHAIKRFSPSSHILLTFTQSDDISLDIAESVKKYVTTMVSEMDKSSSHNESFYHVDCITYAGFLSLLESIDDIARTMPFVCQQCPEELQPIELWLNEYSLSASPVVRISDIYEYVQIHLLQPSCNVDKVLNLLHMRGTIHVMCSSDIVLLRPMTILDELNKVINCRFHADKDFDIHVEQWMSTGIICGKDVDMVWSSYTYRVRCMLCSILQDLQVSYQLHTSGITVVPFKLQNRPSLISLNTFNSSKSIGNVSGISTLHQFVFGDSVVRSSWPSMIIYFNKIPKHFFAKLQIKLQLFATFGGAWKDACALFVTFKLPYIDEEVLCSCVLEESSQDNSLHIHSCGNSNFIILHVLYAIGYIMNEIDTVAITFVEVMEQVISSSTLNSSVSSSLQTSTTSTCRYSIAELNDLYLVDRNAFLHARTAISTSDSGNVLDVRDDMRPKCFAYHLKDFECLYSYVCSGIAYESHIKNEYTELEVLQQCPQDVPFSLKNLLVCVERFESTYTEANVGDYAQMIKSLFSSIPDILHLACNVSDHTTSLSTLWVLGHNKKDDKCYLIPLSVSGVDSFATLIPVCDAAIYVSKFLDLFQSIGISMTSDDNRKYITRHWVSNIVIRILQLLSIPLPRIEGCACEWVGLVDVSSHVSSLETQQKKHFISYQSYIFGSIKISIEVSVSSKTDESTVYMFPSIQEYTKWNSVDDGYDLFHVLDESIVILPIKLHSISMDYDKDIADSTASNMVSSTSIPTVSHKWNVFLSHNWGVGEDGLDNHYKIGLLDRYLRDRNIITWYDENNMGTDITRSICDGIDHSTLFIVFITHKYINKINSNNYNDYCQQEFRYARKRLTARSMIPIVMEPSLVMQQTWIGPIGMHLGDHKYVEFTSSPYNFENFQLQMDAVYLRIIDELAHIFQESSNNDGNKLMEETKHANNITTNKSNANNNNYYDKSTLNENIEHVNLCQLSSVEVGTLLYNIDLKKYVKPFFDADITGQVLYHCESYEDIISELGVVNITMPRVKMLFARIVDFKGRGVPRALLTTHGDIS